MNGKGEIASLAALIAITLSGLLLAALGPEADAARGTIVSKTRQVGVIAVRDIGANE